MPGSGQARSRRWVFTLNNYSEDDERLLQGLATSGAVGYLVYGRERGVQGTPHLQGYVELSSKARLGAVKQLLGSGRYHLEPAGGSYRQASDYCKKDGDYFESGRPIDERPRSDLDDLKSRLEQGEDLVSVARDHFGVFVRNFRGIERYANMVIPPRRHRTRCIWIYGPPGTGKSRWCHEGCGLGDRTRFWLSDISGRWFDGYRGHKQVVIDDFDGSMAWAFLLRLLDRYPLHVATKGGFAEFTAVDVFITSNEPPQAYYGGQLHFRALLRRIDELYDSSKPDWRSCPSYPLEEFAQEEQDRSG